MPRLFGAMRRIDAIGLGLASVLAALACGAAYAALHFGWFRSPWELAGWLVVGLGFVAAGPGGHCTLTPQNTNVDACARAPPHSATKPGPPHDGTSPD